MKWVMVFLISYSVESDTFDMYGFPTFPFDSREECFSIIYNHYAELQKKVNREHNTQDIEYPVICVTEKQFWSAVGTES